jgi:hypothetical protein
MPTSAVLDPGVEIEHLRREMHRLKSLVAILALGLVIVAVAGFHQAIPSVIRARGIIIEDQAGRERILIGAPIPTAQNRVRTDTARVAQMWAGRFPDRAQYMTWYKGYRHSMDGMLILDENGIDRVAVGDSVPDPNIGKRIAPSTGIIINDQEGFERSGYGLLNVNGQYRVVLGLDSKRGTEGLALALRDDGAVGLSVYGSGRSLAFLGNAPANDPSTGVPDSVLGFVVRRGAEVKHIVNAFAPR